MSFRRNSAVSLITFSSAYENCWRCVSSRSLSSLFTSGKKACRLMADNDTRLRELVARGKEGLRCAKQMALKVRLRRMQTNAENCNKQGSFTRSKRLNETLRTLPAVSSYVRKRISNPLAQVHWNINSETLQTRVDARFNRGRCCYRRSARGAAKKR